MGGDEVKEVVAGSSGEMKRTAHGVGIAKTAERKWEEEEEGRRKADKGMEGEMGRMRGR